VGAGGRVGGVGPGSNGWFEREVIVDSLEVLVKL
jgi:hypothetical protein